MRTAHTIVSAIVTASAAVLVTTPLNAQSAGSVVIEASRIVIAPDTMLEGDDARLAIRGGKVIGVGPEIPDELLQRSERVRYEGATVTPGFVVAHDHLDLGDDLAETIDAFTPALRAADAFDPFDESLRELARGGVTTIGLAPLSKNTFAGLAAAVTWDGKIGRVTLEDAYLKLALVRESLDQQRYPTSRMGAADMVRAEFEIARNPLSIASTDHAVLREVVEGNRRLFVHAHTRGEIVTALGLCAELAVDPVLLGATELDECLDRLRGSSITVVLGALDYDSTDRALALPAALAELGVPFSFTASDPRALRRTLALAVRHGVPQRVALAAVTRVPATQLGVNASVGTLLVDRDADLAVFDDDPTNLSARLLAVWCDGEVIHRPDTPDEEPVR